MKNTNSEKIFEVLRLKQVIADTEMELQTIRSPKDAARIARHFIGDEDREVLFVMFLNIKNQVIGVQRCHVGSLNSSIVHPREIFKGAILNNSGNIIMAHNHPSSNCYPSGEDIAVTKRIHEAGAILGIELLDHVIVSPNDEDFTSLKEKNMF